MKHFTAILAVFSCCLIQSSLSTGVDNGFISFSQTSLTSAEDGGGGQYTTVLIPFTRTGGTSGTVAATYQVANSSASADFLSVSNTVAFSDGETTKTGTLILINDALPETNETFLIEIIDARFGAEPGNVTQLLLTVLASDEPHGSISFDAGSLSVSGTEPLSGGASSIILNVNRGPGLFGDVTVNYKVTAGPNLGLLDISLTEGQIQFGALENTSSITFNVLSDDIPENDEQFTVTLSNPGGGAKLADTNTQAQLTVLSNDVPVRFGSTTTTVQEDDGVITVTVYRGSLLDGTQVGPTDQSTTVNYNTTSGTASAGTDFTSSTGTVTFNSGAATATLSIPIINDELPEGDESFTVTLFSPSDDSVLSSPYSISVIIGVNDNAGGVVSFLSVDNQTISEDDQTTATFVVQRTESVIGDIVIGWSILNQDNTLAVDDFNPANGTVTLLDGEDQTELHITAFNDDQAEVAETFTVTIDEVYNTAAKLENESLRIAMLYVSDSDDVYGLLEINSNSGEISVNTSGRYFSFSVMRSGDSVGEVTVQYRVVYLPPGISDPSDGDVSTVAPGSGFVRMSSGVASQTATVEIFNTGFLDGGSSLFVELTSVELTDVSPPPLIEPTASPRLGTVVSITTIVPSAAASGLITFTSGSLSSTVQEPDSGFRTVTLSITRGGSFGTATVTWSVSPSAGSMFTADDILTSSAAVIINDGASSASFDILVTPDNYPELDEPFDVELLVVNEANQRLSDTQVIATITIEENDDPEGTFVIADASKGPHYIMESGSLTIFIQRIGGDLTTEQIVYSVSPNGDSEFFGSTNIVTFSPGESLRGVDITPIQDNLPETNETFTFQISATNSDLIGEDSSVSITILANDDYNGVFSFTNTSLNITIDEPANPGTIDDSLVTVANFTVKRTRGMFGPATVYWSAIDNTTDIIPSSGSVDFTENQETVSFSIFSANDQITELDITHSVELTSVVGGGRVADADNTASLTIRKNDAPIGFLTKDTFRLGEEGDDLTLTVTRGGEAVGVVTATFVVQYTTSTSNDTIVTPLDGLLIFEDGVTSLSVNVSLIDDDIPEINEELLLNLVSTTGDVTIDSSNDQSQITILSSDDAHGVFAFSTNSTTVTATEGTTITLIVERDRGTFDACLVTWQLYLINENDELVAALPDEDFDVVYDVLTFNEYDTSKSIVVHAMVDNEPEITERFQVQLLNVTQGRIDSNGSSSDITIPANDDAFGVIGFSGESSGDIWIAEDVTQDNIMNDTALFNVSRTAGTFGTVQAVWEIHSIDSPALPLYTDVILEGTIGPDVKSLDIDYSRPFTETIAYNFTGESSQSVVTLPDQSYSDAIPHGAVSDGDFSISTWMYLDPVADGIILAKASEDGSTIRYGLGVYVDNENVTVTFYYLPTLEEVGFLTVRVSVSQSSFSLMEWHSLIVTVSNTTVWFYVDGVAVPSGGRSLNGSISDGEGTLTIGGLSQSMFYEGYLQDVRIYFTALTQEQVYEIATQPAAMDVSPVAGMVTFSDGDNDGLISISSVTDNDSEFSELFDIRLTYVNNGGVISDTNNQTMLTVLKSDYSNGLFGFSSADAVSTAIEGDNVTLMVTRDRGTYSNVTVQWRVTIDGDIADMDFTYSSGEVVFAPSETQKFITLQVSDDMVPELLESFIVTLTTATPSDEYPSTDPDYSGAAINATLSQAVVNVTENDYPHGVAQFAVTEPVGDNIIPIDTRPVIEIDVEEDAGSITIYVVRAQGVNGVGVVQYTINDGTATSGVDYDASVSDGSITFGDGERVKSFTIDLIDNETPELHKYFFLNLTIPNEDSLLKVSINQALMVTILPSDDAYGVFSFTDESLSTIVDEEVGGVLVTLTVFRGSKGTFGDISVYWKVGGGVDDITPSDGYVNFTEGQTSSDLVVTINNDMIAEFHEEHQIVLESVIGGGRILTEGGVNIAVITINANDYPYGLFLFTDAYRPHTVIESTGNTSVVILREFGMKGRVRVNYRTMMAANLGQDFVATEGTDYTAITDGSVVFETNQTTASITVYITTDNVPELDETFYIVLTNATLLDESPIADVLPAISSEQNNASIVIEENGNARGVVQLSSASFSVSEGDTGSITVERDQGTLGDAVVYWSIVLMQVLPSDLSSLSGTTTIPSGLSNATVELTIEDDTVPELDETFTIELTGTNDGATLGDIQSAMVTIAANDDPNGVFGFDMSSQNMRQQEPESGNITIFLAIERAGGTIGVSIVSWNLMSNEGGVASADIQPTQGTVMFSSGEDLMNIELAVMADDVPEIEESFTVTLSSVTNGRIDSDVSQAIVTISANDKPFGHVSLQSQAVIATEKDGGSFTIQRTGALLGTVDILFDIRRSYPAALDLFASPITGVSPLSMDKILEVTSFETQDIANECAINCVVAYSLCAAFIVDTSDEPLCEIYSQTTGSGNMSRPNSIEYYEAISGQLEPLAQHLATPNEDFVAISSGNVSLANGIDSTVVMVTILDDTTPELSENFSVVLTSVSVSNSEYVDDEDLPTFNDMPLTVSISENDSPYGLLTIHSGEQQEVSVREGTSATFTIIRKGDFGDISVTWNTSIITPGLEPSELSELQDTVVFLDGETRHTFSINAFDDDIPEGAESVLVFLSNPLGGAVLGGVNETVVTMIIQANDGAAGTVGFAVNSRAVTIVEGADINLVLQRTVGQSGDIRVYWTINGTNPEAEFEASSGSVDIAHGMASMTFSIAVKDDNSSELDKTFDVILTKVEAISDDVGEPSIDMSASIARLTVQASDNPYGEIGFSTNSLNLNTDEENPLNLTIIRTFGSNGAIRIQYRGVASVPGINPQQLAIAGSDFNDQLMTAEMAAGVSAVEIQAPIIDDDMAEFQEFFSVEIVSGFLISDPNVSVPVSAIFNSSVIIITESDNPNGIIQFLNGTYVIDENIGIFNIEVVRSSEAISMVSINYQINHISTNDNDFIGFQPSGVLNFMDGVNSNLITLDIFDDAMPEVGEEFCIQLFSSDENVMFGEINTTCITISASDDPHGVFSFDDESLQSILTEEMNNNEVTLTISRSGGTIGSVTVPINVDSAGIDDVTLSNSIPIFAEGEDIKTITVTAIADSLPELNETLLISLGTPSAGRLSTENNTAASVTILANEDPYGILTLSTVDGMSSLSVDEDVGNATLEVRRTVPSFGEVTVFVSTNQPLDGSGDSDLQPSDFQEIATTVTLQANQASAIINIPIFDDLIPETDEIFYVNISNPTGGAELGDVTSIPVTILTNDDAHGAIGFTMSSLSVVATEPSGINSQVSLEVEREGGTIGEVTVQWEITGKHSDNEITPSSGEVTFANGVSSDTIVLTIAHDNEAELDEVTMVTLTDITEDGVPEGGDGSRGARLIDERKTSVVTVLANDDPHGVFQWSVTTLSVTESSGMSTLNILRESGTIGDVLVTYRVFSTSGGFSSATMGEDFQNVTESIVFPDGQTVYSVNITVYDDDVPELDEFFNIEIVSVALVNESVRQGSESDTPLIRQGFGSVLVEILENDDPYGILEFSNTETLEVDENDGVVCVAVSRTQGLFEEVGLDYITTGVTAIGGGTDFTPDFGTIEIGSFVDSACIEVTIINDLIAETEETFTITLLNAFNGANLGTNLTKTVAIRKNDDINGVFSFAANSLVLLVPEGNTVTLTINRAKGTVGVVTVYWVLEETGWNDLTPNLGNVTFQEDDSSKSFTIMSVEDGQPELYESYSVHLMSLSGDGGRIGSPKTASIAIPASDEPSGVIGLVSYPMNTIIVQEGESFTVSATRSGGLFGTVNFQWELSPADSTVFAPVSAIEGFSNGENFTTFTIATIQDSKAEIARQFELSIVSVGDASINDSISTVMVIVAASDNVHGVVSFDSTSTTFEEGDGTVSVTIERTGGLVGDIRVNYTTENREAFSPSDYTVSTNSLVIPEDDNTATISVSIVDDDIPEVEESFVIILQSVELTEDINGGRDFTFEGDVSLIDSDPILGGITTTTIDIAENDDARGLFSFASSSISTTEGSTISVDIERTKGTFGTSTIFYTVTEGSATNGDDYTTAVPSGSITFGVGQSSATLMFSIVDDTAPELQESFTVELTGLNGGGSLGSFTTLTVSIAPNDDPYGTVSFDTTELVVDNPTLNQVLQLMTVSRSGGGLVDIDLSISVNGTTDDILLQPETLQIPTSDSDAIFQLIIVETSVPEPEEVYVVTLTSNTNGVLVEEDGRQLVVTIRQNGEPYGEFAFYGEALGTQIASEHTNLTFPVRRNEGQLGDVLVYFEVTGGHPSTDVSPSSGNISFQDGQIFSVIVIQTNIDSIPELSEDFTLRLTGASGGAVIDSTASTASFVIEANESPYGVFGIVNTSISLTTLTDGSIIRTLSFSIERDQGTHGVVQADVSVTYLPEPNSGYYISNLTRVFAEGQAESFISIDSTADAFLEPYAAIQIAITKVELVSNSDEDVLPEISSIRGSVDHIIENSVANAVVGFSSVQATVIDGLDVDNVVLTVERNGSVGGVQISWTVGMDLEGVANGSLTPIVGSVMIPANQNQTTLTLTATPTDPPSYPEVFAVNLYVETLSSLAAKLANERGTAVIEQRGVVKLTYDSFSYQEGSTVQIAVSRVFGSLGEIVVSGITATATPTDLGTSEIAADPITDYPLGERSVTLASGQTSGDILLILPYNSGTSPLKVFTFQLTHTTITEGEGSVTTPRLATPIAVVPVTIVDSDGGAGVFEFINSSTTISEEGSPLVQTYIERTTGLLGTVTVEVVIQSNRADGSIVANQIASESDYDATSLFSLITFASNENLKPVSIQIIDDNVPELTEYFTLKLQNPMGGKAIINSDKSTYEIAISPNDNQGGLYTLITHSLVLSEDDTAEGVLFVLREQGLFEAVEINWRASYTDGQTHTVALGDLLVATEGVVTFVPGQSLGNFTIALQTDKVPLTSETFTITISSDATGIVFGTRTATIVALPSGFSIFQFTESSRKVISGPFTVTLGIERTKGLTLDTSIQYSTEEPTEPVTVGQLTFEPALAGSHFTLIAGDTIFFEPNKANESLHISIISTDTIARAFYVNLQAVDSSDSVINSQAIVVISPLGTLSDLYSVYFSAIDASPNNLYSVATDLKSIVDDQGIPGTDTTQSAILLYTLEEIVNTITNVQYSYTNAMRSVMSEIYEAVVSDSTYSGRTDVADSLTAFGNSLLSGRSCDNNSVIVPQTSFTIRSIRAHPSNLHTLELITTDNDRITLPNTNLEVTTECVNVIFTAYSTTNLFTGPVLGNKVLTLSLREPDISRLNTPLTYRISSPSGNVFPSTNSCLLWHSSSAESYWDSSTCKLARSSIVEMDHIECECQSVGEFAVATPPNYGWTLPGPISCAFVTLVMIVIIVLHLYYFRRITLGTRILIMFCAAVAIFELIALVDMVVSVDVSSGGCVAMGLLLQLSVVSMFVWLLVLIVSLWLNLMGFTNGHEPLIIYIFISWGLSVAIVIATVLLGIYALSYSFNDLYGRVGELCFIPSAAVAGVSTALPIVLALLFAIGMVSHSCIYWSKWEDIQSLYKDTYNRRDIPLLLILYLLVVLVVMFGGLHLYLQQIYLFFVFFGFNVIFGAYALVVYVFMSWHTLTWKHKHYPNKEEVQPFSIPGEPEFGDIQLRPLTSNSNYGSQQSLIPRYQEHTAPRGIIKSNTGSITGESSRPPASLPVNKQPAQNSYIEPPSFRIPSELDATRTQTPSHVTRSEISSRGDGGDSDSGESGNYEITLGSDGDDQMDDLLYAIRTGGGASEGGYTASQGGEGEDDDDMRPLIDVPVSMRRTTGDSDQYRMRRISIADTHI